jgi:hypothetical protein
MARGRSRGARPARDALGVGCETDEACAPMCSSAACKAYVAAPLGYLPFEVQVGMLPVSRTTTEPFYDTVADYLPVIFIIIYLYAVYNIISTFILEKETKIRESLRIGDSSP